MNVTSGDRKSVRPGGAKRSQHLFKKAADFHVEGMTDDATNALLHGSKNPAFSGMKFIQHGPFTKPKARMCIWILGIPWERTRYSCMKAWCGRMESTSSMGNDMRSDNRIRRARCYSLTGLLMTMLVFVPASSKVSPPISSAFYPLKVGNRWKYRPERGISPPRAKSSTWTVVDITKESGKHLVTLNNTPALDDDAIMVLSLSGGVISEWDSGHKVFVEDKPVGFTWSYKVKDYTQRKGLDVFRVTAIGSCRIPKHIFGSCISIEETNPESRLITLTTYAKGVGPVMYRYTRIGQTHPAGTWVLTEWSLR